MPVRLSALLASGETEIVGPDDASALRVYADEPEPPLATKAQVEVMIGKLAMATAQSKRTQAEVEERLDLYWLALNDIPVEDLRLAFDELLRSDKFLPAPAEVRAAAFRPGARRRYLKSRARWLAWLHEREWRPPVEYMTAADLRADAA